MRGEEHLYIKSIFRYRFNSLLTKIFISYISILCVVVAAGITVYLDVEQVLKNKETDVSKDYLNYVSRIVDGEFLHIKERMYEFLNNPINSANLNMIQKDINSQMKLVQGLNNFTSNSAIISEVYLYNRQLSFVISDSGSNDKSAFLRRIVGPAGESNSNQLDSVKDFRIFVSNANNVNTIAMVIGESYSSNQNRMITLIDEKEIFKVITNTSIVKYGSAYMVDRGGLIMSSSEPKRIGDHLGNDLMKKIEQGSGASINDQGNLVVYEKSGSFDGYYVTLIPYENILKETAVIRNIFIYVFLALFLIAGGIAGIYGRMIYHPIVRLMNKLRSMRPGDADSREKNEIDVISGFIDHIQTSISHYEEESILSRIMEADTISGSIRSMFPQKDFLVAVISSVQSTSICRYAREYLKDFSPQGFLAKVSAVNDEECYFVANGENLSTESVKNYVLMLKSHIESKNLCFTVVGLGGIAEGPEKLGVSLKQALTAIKQGSVYDEHFLFEYQSNTKERFHLYFPIDFDNRITDAVTLGSEEKVSQLIHYIFEQNKELPYIYMKIIYTKFFDTYMMLANKCSHKFYMNEITEIVEQEYRGVRVKAFITKLYTELIPYFQAPVDTAKRVEQFVTQFIEHNFNRDVTIEEIADALRLSAPYVSTLFKKSTGIAFSQYLLEYRMKKAMELLISTDYSIKEISQHVCAGTYNSFIRSFRTLIGVSPGEYRTLNQNKLTTERIGE